MRTKYLDIEKVNENIKKDAKSYVDACEKEYRNQLVEISEKILSKKKPVKVILLGGPSCAGKTTSSRLLDELMTEKGKNVVPIEMDNFFISLVDLIRLDVKLPHYLGVKFRLSVVVNDKFRYALDLA